ncbi:Tannase/feruloyl esterase [Aspergillus egyptiacus]|nr:Tannase/feruloyl esterase [Aspergillus egyptiacus]
MGGGGWVGGTLGALSQAVFHGYAAVSTDAGHAETATVESWALAGKGNLNWPNLQDFSAVAIDEATTLGKMATEIFYGQPPKYSYWNGCSTGGRQGHMMAQRYPTQYDGILATAPAINWDKFIPSEMWPQIVMTQLDYYPSAFELQAITQHAIDACDELDGVRDGIISAPGLCQFDPLTVVGKTAQCTSLNAEIEISQKAAELVSRVWAGAKDTKGSFLWYGLSHDTPLESLAGTNCTLPTETPCAPVPFQISADWMRIFLSTNPSLDLSTIDYAEFSRLFRASVNQFSSVIGTRDPDLTGFKQAGGKMIAWHGMKDELITFNGTVDYYRHALEVDPELHDYYRLFLAPGVEHCSAGIGWYPGSSFQALVDWVELGTVPDTLRAIATPAATDSASPPLRTADLCAYPKVLTYVAGDSNVASSYTCI